MTLLRIALFALAAGSLSAAPAYKFTLNGEPVDADILPVTGKRLGAPAPGDVGSVSGFPFVLQQPGHYQFRIGGRAPGDKLFARINEGEEHCVSIRMPIPGFPNNPLATLSHAEKSKLWGVRLGSHLDDWDKHLSAVDWEKAILVLDSPLLPSHEFPSGLRYFSYLDYAVAKAWSGLAARLASQSELRFLDLQLDPEHTFDLSALKAATELRNLNIKDGIVSDSHSLSTNKHLRFLKLRSLKGLDSLGFAHELPQLRVLKVDETDVTDPSPLAGLNELRLFSANATKLSVLPPLETLPALRDLRLHSTPVAKNGKEAINALRPKMSVLVKNWDPSIKGFEAHDAKNPPPEKPILFLGSSSIRKWKLKDSFPGLPTLNRGFGGSELSDALRYFDRIVLPYRPRAILLYAGDNDIGNGETPEQVIADYKKFAAKVRAQLPHTHFAFLPIKPSLKRWELWPDMKKANHAIRELTWADDHLHYLDTATPMLGDDGTPKPGLFLDDGLHLTEAGYAIWNAVVTPWLQQL